MGFDILFLIVKRNLNKGESKMKRFIIISLLLSGCTTTTYKPQTIEVRRGHSVRLYDNLVEVQNSYAVYNLKGGGKLRRDSIGGFFSYVDNRLHCAIDVFDICILHEYKHLLGKYGLKFPNYEPHFVDSHGASY
jgi:hypothetical protein